MDLNMAKLLTARRWPANPTREADCTPQNTWERKCRQRRQSVLVAAGEHTGYRAIPVGPNTRAHNAASEAVTESDRSSGLDRQVQIDDRQIGRRRMKFPGTLPHGPGW